MLSVPSSDAVFEAPITLALCAAAVLVAVLLLVASVAWVTLRRVDRVDLPTALLGLAHVISALCGLLPWGRPTPPPALPQRSPEDAGPPAEPVVVLMRTEPAAGSAPARRMDP